MMVLSEKLLKMGKSLNTEAKRQVKRAGIWVFLTLAVFPQEAGAGWKENTVAVVNGKNVSRKEYGEYIFKNANSFMLLENYVSTLLFAGKAKEMGIEVSETDVEKVLSQRVTEQLSRWKVNEETYNNLLKDMGMTENGFIELLKNKNKREVLSDLYASRIIYKEKGITDSQVRERFEKEYGTGGRKYRLRHIFRFIRESYLTKTSGGYSAAIEKEKENAKKKIEAIRRRVELECLSRFAEIAMQVSEDPITRDFGGNIGRFVEGRFKGDFDRVVPALKEGELSPVVESERGFHIVKVDKKDENGMDISHILAGVNHGFVRDLRDWDIKKKKARGELEMLQGRLKAGEDFEELAGQYSDDYTKLYGSDISGRWESFWGSEFTKALKGLYKGDTAVIESAKGLHLVMVDDIIEKELNDEVKMELKREIESSVAPMNDILELAVRLLKEAKAYYKL